MNKKPSVLIIFLTVFIDLIGFGIVLPLLPIFAKTLNASGFTIGALIASYSLMQFIFAPIWGRLSDRIGRRPVLLVSTAAAAFSYALFAVGCGMNGNTALVVLFVSRILAGICGANIAVAQAYIADITPPEQRSKKMGLIGMAFGLGFIFGPALAGFSMGKWGPTGPGWVAASFCALNFIFAAIRLPESLKRDAEHVPVQRRPGMDQWMHTLGQPKIGLLVLVFFLATFCFACFETTLGLLVSRNFKIDFNDQHDAKIVGYLFAYCGIIGALVQGGAIGAAVRKLGEPRLICVSLVLMGFSFLPMPFLSGEPAAGFMEFFSTARMPWLGLLIVLAMLAIGSSMNRPPLFGLLSRLTSATEQGATIGVAQGAGSLARILGPIFAGTLFEISPAIPYLICAVLSIFTGIIALRMLSKSAA
jgi:DHA1 family tetracycline resistance protein-like MFS transporter